MKRFFAILLTLCLLTSLSTVFSAEEISAEKTGWMSYEEYFSENRLLPATIPYKYPYSLADSRGFGRYTSRVNADFGEYIIFCLNPPNLAEFNINHYPSIIERHPQLKETGTAPGEVLLEKKSGQGHHLFSLGDGFDEFIVCCGYMYTLKDGEFCRWNMATLEKDVFYSCADSDMIELLGITDELVFFRVGSKIYRYYAPSRTLDMVLENDYVGNVYPTENNVIVIQQYSQEYAEIMTAAGFDFKDETATSKHPKDFETFYAWANQKFGLNLTVPTTADLSGNYYRYSIDYFLKSIDFNDYYILEGFDLKSQSFIEGYVIDGGIRVIFPNEDYHPEMEGIVPLPDEASPWLGNDVKDLPTELVDAMALVPTGAYWGESVTEATHAYTSLGNNQARALLAALMEEKNITRPEQRELLTVEGKEEIPAEEIKTLFESLYGSGSADDILSYDVIGDANAGDMLLKKANGNYVYCWAPYAGSELNAEQYIRYLSHETEGDTLNIYTVYGYYRLDDGRETYKLYGDALSLRPLEFETTAPIASGTVGDGTLTNLRNGELDEKLTVYEHTFVKNADGSYYWASSAPITSPSEPVEEESPIPWGLWIGIGAVLAATAVAVPVSYRLKKKRSA